MPPEIVDLNDWQVKEWPSTPEGEERQAREVVQMYDTLFSHPLVEAITTWSVVDGKWLNAPAGLLRADNSSKPAYDQLLQKVKTDWWTNTKVITDDQGYAVVTGFQGYYEAFSAHLKAEFTLDKSNGEEILHL